jgi:integrase
VPLTDAKARSAKPEPGKKVRQLTDGHGLRLCIMPTGSKLWRVAYRFEGRAQTLSLGRYPSVGIAAAREAAKAARALLARGINPNTQKKVNKTVADVWTFDAIAVELIDKKMREGKSERTIKKLRWLFELAGPFVGGLPVASITAPQVLTALQRVEAKGHLETATRMREAIGAVFRFAVATGRAENDPTFALRGALASPKVEHRPAILEPKAVGALLRAIDGFQGQPTTRACLQLMALLFPRPGELRLAEWSEFDLDRAAWNIPAKRTKMRREHSCPLPRQAIEVLEALRPFTDHGALVFPGLRTDKRPISENTLNGALRRLGYAKDEMTAHGFRATASTMLNESGLWSHDAIERALAHQDPDAARRAYARGRYSDERARMAQWWADHLDDLRKA